MGRTVKSTIKSIVRHHLKVEKSLCFGQCLTAVGWVGGTLPELYEEDGMVEVTTADVANGGFVVGAGLTGIRPIYDVRYQGFQWYNSPIIVNYAAKSKEIWDRPCPIFIRSIAMEGGMGPVAGSSHHSLYQRMPGTRIISPMTPLEYTYAYDQFMSEDEVYYISEHRRSYENTEELNDVILEDSDVVLFPISITRFDAEQARKMLLDRGIKASIIHQLWIKPFIFEDDETYIAVNYDWSNLEERIDYVLGNYKEVRQKLVWNMRNRYREEYEYSKIALHLYDVFKSLEAVEV